jgi:hypothetical protein
MVGCMPADDVLAAVQAFAARIHALDPKAAALGELTLSFHGRQAQVPITAPVAASLAEALRSYHDSRDFGSCDHCDGGQLDDNFLCLSCGRPNGLFGQMLSERAVGHVEPPSLPATGRQMNNA